MCGRAACVPRPSIRITKLSSLAMMPPARVENVPARIPGMLCAPKIASTGKRSNSPSAIIAFAPRPCSSAGWKMKRTVPSKSLRSASSCAAPSTIDMWPSCPHACILPGVRDACSRPGACSAMFSASMSARMPIARLPVPAVRFATRAADPAMHVGRASSGCARRSPTCSPLRNPSLETGASGGAAFSCPCSVLSSVASIALASSVVVDRDRSGSVGMSFRPPLPCGQPGALPREHGVGRFADAVPVHGRRRRAFRIDRQHARVRIEPPAARAPGRASAPRPATPAAPDSPATSGTSRSLPAARPRIVCTASSSSISMK